MRSTAKREAIGRIVGTGRAFGGQVVTNHDLDKVIDTDDAWIVVCTGTQERRFVQEGIQIARCFPNTTVLTSFLATGT